VNTRLVGQIVAGTALVGGACAVVYRYVDRQLDRGTTGLTVDRDREPELRVDVEVLRRIYALPCGIDVDAETGLITPNEELPFGAIRIENVPGGTATTSGAAGADPLTSLMEQIVQHVRGMFGHDAVQVVDLSRLQDDVSSHATNNGGDGDGDGDGERENGDGTTETELVDEPTATTERRGE
jgi:hypothetical protein